MSRKVTLDQVKSALRARACQFCPLRHPGQPGDPLDVERPLDCEPACDLFTHVPKLYEVARHLDPMLRSYDQGLGSKISEVVRSIGESQSGHDGRSSPLRRHRQCIIRTLTELVDR